MNHPKLFWSSNSRDHMEYAGIRTAVQSFYMQGKLITSISSFQPQESP